VDNGELVGIVSIGGTPSPADTSATGEVSVGTSLVPAMMTCPLPMGDLWHHEETS